MTAVLTVVDMASARSPPPRMFVPTHLTQRMFGCVPLVWICNPGPLSIRIFNPPGNNVLNQNSACGNKTATSSLSFLLMMIKNGIQDSVAFTGKERDSETGYGYFGARYMDHELMTMWLSVDPMADKYPSISPYAYCAWNPMKLVDPDGEEIYPTQTSAKQDRNLAIKLFGKDNVSKIFNRGTQNNPDYVFYVHAPKSIDSRQKVNAIISSRGELRKYEFGGAPRKIVISGTLSLGIQVDLNRLVRANISSIDLVSTGIDAYYSDYYIRRFCKRICWD